MAIAPPPSNGGKKQFNKNQIQKRNRVLSARNIRTEAVIASAKANKKDGSNDLSEGGTMLNVGQFISSRQFEIKELQLAMHRSKVSGSTRVFQDLPRRLRRRTASHNVKRIPKRMRNRALREMMKNDQEKTILKTSSSRHGLTAKALYKAKMSVKLLRLASTSTSMKLALPPKVNASANGVRQKIRTLQALIKKSRAPCSRVKKLNNSMGSYDNITTNKLAQVPHGRQKYMKRQHVFAWLPTHIWNAKRSHMMKRWGYQIPYSATQKCFKMTHRIGGNVSTSDGTLCMDSSFMGTIVVRATDAKTEKLRDLIAKITSNRAIAPKYYNSNKVFSGLFTDPLTMLVLGPGEIIWCNHNLLLLRVHPAMFQKVFEILAVREFGFKVEDSRFAIGSITINGAESLSSLTSIIRSSTKSESFEQLKLISNVTDQNILPKDMSFSFKAIDPRHFGAPKKVKQNPKEVTIDKIMELQANTPKNEICETLEALCSTRERTTSYKNQQTMKQIHKRRRDMTKKGEHVSKNAIIPFDEKKDPEIPIYIYKRESTNDWVILMPWFWHLPFWYQLNKIPRKYNIGLRQFQQLQFEHKKLYFPDDYPFTETGFHENSYYKEEVNQYSCRASRLRRRFKSLGDLHKTKIPACKYEFGCHSSCDWRALQILRNGLLFLTKGNKKLILIDAKKTSDFVSDDPFDISNYSEPERKIESLNDLVEYTNDFQYEEGVPISRVPVELVDSHLVKEKVIRTQSDLVKQPLKVTAVTCKSVERGHIKDNARIYEIPKDQLSYWKQKAKGVYSSNGKLLHDEETPLPEVYNLIGFVTSGTYDLGVGSSTGTGFVDHGFYKHTDSTHVLVRNVQTCKYRLATIEKIII
ncbi:hypothetical protein C6P45_003383 [Maudiozyma exigua]|uniref:Pop1 N-terminal domain-containing protein n=1 Tax=Maudiozyma exigua TaxID=34358 RepID=A0A9P6WBU3_MAUEX|nr:hypothetical protein C6P45_003383 [Kazachstania exigua]